MGFGDNFKDLANKAKDKGTDLAEQHGETIEDGIDRGAGAAKNKWSTHADKIDAGANKVKDVLGGVDADDDATEDETAQR